MKINVNKFKNYDTLMRKKDRKVNRLLKFAFP